MKDVLHDSEINEKACELAHKDVEKNFPMKVWLVKGRNGEMNKYTDDAQKYFDERYDYYWDEIVEGRIA